MPRGHQGRYVARDRVMIAMFVIIGTGVAMLLVGAALTGLSR
jgi:hypothetical protein